MTDAIFFQCRFHERERLRWVCFFSLLLDAQIYQETVSNILIESSSILVLPMAICSLCPSPSMPRGKLSKSLAWRPVPVSHCEISVTTAISPFWLSMTSTVLISMLPNSADAVLCRRCLVLNANSVLQDERSQTGLWRRWGAPCNQVPKHQGPRILYRRKGGGCQQTQPLRLCRPTMWVQYSSGRGGI